MAESRAIIFIGPPGSGKGTQAHIIEETFQGYRHFDTGRAIDRAVHDPRQSDNPVVQIERERFEKGYLTSSEFKIKIIREGIESIARDGKRIIFSGSPRTVDEARMLVPLLEEIYGAGSIVVIHLVIKKETTVYRNTRRRICKQCSAPLLWTLENEKIAFCPRCGGELVTRVDDFADVIETRLKEYSNFTEKVLPLFVAMNVPVYDIDGERDPDTIAKDIAEKIIGGTK